MLMPPLNLWKVCSAKRDKYSHEHYYVINIVRKRRPPPIDFVNLWKGKLSLNLAWNDSIQVIQNSNE